NSPPTTRTRCRCSASTAPWPTCRRSPRRSRSRPATPPRATMPASSGSGALVRIGLISDTHGLLRPEAVAALQGSDYIVHAGDIGDPAILDELARIAPVSAVRGNNDKGREYAHVPQTEVLDAGGLLLYVIHDLAELDLDPAAADFRVVVSGHSHQPAQ